MTAAPRWREIARDAASALFVPVVLILIPLNAVVIRNRQELRYDPALMHDFLYAGIALWAVGFAIAIAGRARAIGRIWFALPWSILLLDVVGTSAQRHGLGLATAVSIDVAIVALVVALAIVSPSRPLQTVAAVVGGVLLMQGLWAHASFVRMLKREEVLRAARRDAPVHDPGSQAPGNVYHILLDNYLSESFAYSTGATAAQRYPGFTYFSRFNTNFPRTSSSEPALIDGQLPVAGSSVDDWRVKAIGHGMWKDLADAGVGVWVYGYQSWACADYQARCLVGADLQQDIQTSIARRTIVDLWAQRLLPGSARRYLNARAAGGAASPEATAGFSASAALAALLARAGVAPATEPAPAAISALPSQYFNLKLFDQMLADEADRPAHGQYVYYHALIPHPLFIMNERCEFQPMPAYDPPTYWGHVACANLMIERLVRELARLGRLDDALIIVHSDHGDMDFLLWPRVKGEGTEFAVDAGARTYQPLDKTYEGNDAAVANLNDGDSRTWRSMAVEVFSSGLMLVKFPHAKTYAEDHRPVELLDIAPTVLAHFGAKTSRPLAGVRLERAPEVRSSAFFVHNRTFAGGFAKYLLTDHGWQFTSETIPFSNER